MGLQWFGIWVHLTITCDGSGQHPLLGPRFHKIECEHDEHNLSVGEFAKLELAEQRAYEGIVRPGAVPVPVTAKSPSISGAIDKEDNGDADEQRLRLRLLTCMTAAKMRCDKIDQDDSGGDEENSCESSESSQNCDDNDMAEKITLCTEPVVDRLYPQYVTNPPRKMTVAKTILEIDKGSPERNTPAIAH